MSFKRFLIEIAPANPFQKRILLEVQQGLAERGYELTRVSRGAPVIRTIGYFDKVVRGRTDTISVWISDTSLQGMWRSWRYNEMRGHHVDAFMQALDDAMLRRS